MLYITKSSKNISKLAQDLEKAVANHKFGVLGKHDLKQTMNNKGVEFNRECIIYEVCNPHQAKKILEANMEISTALPCRISVYVEDDKTVLATIKPTSMIALYPNPELQSVAEDVENTLMNIMKEACE